MRCVLDITLFLRFAPLRVLDEVGKCVVIVGGRELSGMSQLVVCRCCRLWVNDLYVAETLQGVLDSDSAY